MDEGDRVSAGQVVARIDTRDLQASLAQAEAQITQARHTIAESEAELVQDSSQLKLAAQELERARDLVPKGFETQEVLDQQSDNLAHAISGAGGGLLSMALTLVAQ